MSRKVAAAVMVGLMAAIIIIWSGFGRVEPDSARTVTRADAASVLAPMISPFEIMVGHGKNLPAEHWRDAF
jgi:hypothetical protein